MIKGRTFTERGTFGTQHVVEEEVEVKEGGRSDRRLNKGDEDELWSALWPYLSDWGGLDCLAQNRSLS